MGCSGSKFDEMPVTGHAQSPEYNLIIIILYTYIYSGIFGVNLFHTKPSCILDGSRCEESEAGSDAGIQLLLPHIRL